MRRKFSIILTAVVIGVIMGSGCGLTLNSSENLSEAPTGGEWLAGWLYRKAHNITGSSAGLQLNYPISLCVHFDNGVDNASDVYVQGKCRPDFGDIRFTDVADNILDYWIQEKVDGVWSVFWVEVSFVAPDPACATIYMYYGNATATTTSNKNFVFPLATDFEDNTTQGWSISWVTYTSYDGLSTNADQGNYCRYAGRAYGYPNGVGRGAFSEKFQTEVYLGAGSYCMEGACRFVDRGQPGFRFVVEGAVVAEIGSPETQWRSLAGNFTVNTHGFVNVDVEFSVYVGDYVQYEHNSYCIDTILIRKWCDPEPTHGTWGVMETWADDRLPPSIVSVAWAPSSPPPFVPSVTPRHGELVNVWANVTDDGSSGVDGVQLSYRPDNDRWCDVPMTWNETSGLWRASIPGYPCNCSVEFFVTSQDGAGNVAASAMQGYSVRGLPTGDVDGDGDVDIYDLVKIAAHYGESW